MSELGDIMGDEFEEKYSEKSRRNREAKQLPDEVMMEICHIAINEDGFKGEEPRFRYDHENGEEDIFLMESPDNLDKFTWDLGDDAKSVSMYHLDELYSLGFQNNMLHLLDKLEPDQYYLVAGNYYENTKVKDGEEETYSNVNPIRGIIPLAAAKQLAEKYEEEMEGTSVEEQSQQQTSTNQEANGTGGGIDMGGLENEPDVSESDVEQVFHAIGNKKPEILKETASGDDRAIDKLVNVTQNNVDGEADREFILDVFEDKVEEIEGRGEDGEEEDDGLDLGGLEDDSDDSTDMMSEASEDSTGEEVEATATTSSGSSSSDSDDSSDNDVEDWFDD